LIVSIVVGQLFFDSSSMTNLFYHDMPSSTTNVIIYTMKYYGLALLTVIGISSVFIVVAVLGQTTTTVVGTGMGFLLVSFGYPIVFTVINHAENLKLPIYLQFLSLTQIQYQGIASSLADAAAFSSQQFSLEILLILGGYIMVCASGAYFAFTKTDRWI
jgi:ABC-2 type transport system permease protein